MKVSMMHGQGLTAADTDPAFTCCLNLERLYAGSWLFRLGPNGFPARGGDKQILKDASDDMCFLARLSGMTHPAILHRPRNLPIMAGPAVFPIDDLEHVDVRATQLERKPQVGVADLTAKSDAMKPVGKHHRSHAFLSRTLV
jgi:hypothetical protein